MALSTNFEDYSNSKGAGYKGGVSTDTSTATTPTTPNKEGSTGVSTSSSKTGLQSDYLDTKEDIESKVNLISATSDATSSILGLISNYRNAKSNYKAVSATAEELLEQTAKEVAQIRANYEKVDAANRLFIANSGLESSSFTDVRRSALINTEKDITEMETAAKKKAKAMIKAAKKAKKKAKKAAIYGGILGVAGGVAGGMYGGPTGAAIGTSAGTQIGSSLASF